jgi:hypothetical protein
MSSDANVIIAMKKRWRHSPPSAFRAFYFLGRQVRA